MADGKNEDNQGVAFAEPVDADQEMALQTTNTICGSGDVSRIRCGGSCAFENVVICRRRRSICLRMPLLPP